MKHILLIGLLTLLPIMAFAKSSDTEKQQALKEFKPYAKYFGFSDPEQYLNFANKMEMLIAGSFTPGPPLQEDPIYRAYIGTPHANLSEDQKQQIEHMMLTRRQQLADALGVPVEELEASMNAYLNYRDLTTALNKLEQKKRVAVTGSAAQKNENKPSQVLAVTAEMLELWGGYGTAMMKVGLRDMAVAKAIPLLSTFVVSFESIGKTESFRYSYPAGAFLVVES